MMEAAADIRTQEPDIITGRVADMTEIAANGFEPEVIAFCCEH